MDSPHSSGASRRDTELSSSIDTRAPYTAPTLEHLGAWSALTLQQSVPIGPGGDMPPWEDPYGFYLGGLS